MATDHRTKGETNIGRARLRQFSFSALMVLLCVSASMAFAADAMSQSADFDIAPQAIESALHEWSRQSNVQVMVASEEVTGQRTDGVKGRLTAANALARLLQQTDLTYEAVGSNTISVKRVAAATPTKPAETSMDQTRSQEGEGNSRGGQELEEIIVTAQKREQNLRDVPISLSVLGGADLDRSTAQGVTEALSKVPGVAVGENPTGGGTQLGVRGVTAASGLFFGSSPIGYYLDGMPVAFVKSAIVPDPDVYDLKRVEVLRGPQGTLYGASSMNGVVRVLTEDANLDAIQFKARASGSVTEEGGDNQRGDMAVNVPIIDGKLAARGVVGYQRLSGWIDKPNAPAEDVNDGELRNMRLKVNAQPTENLSVGMSAWISRSDFGGPSAADDYGNRVSAREEPISTDFDGYGLSLEYEFPIFSVTSMTSYLDYANSSVLDLRHQPGREGLLPPQGDLQTLIEANTFSQEVLLNSLAEESWRWTLGGIYRDGEDRTYQHIPGVRPAPTDITNISKSYAVFGELTRLLLDGKLELTAGLRHFEDDVGSREHSRPDGTPAERLVSADSTFHATTPRFVVTWHAANNSTIYVSYAEGFRSGSDQNPGVLAVAPTLPPVKPDRLTNYEVGVKGSLLDGRVGYDAAGYFIDWQNVQQPITVFVDNNPRGAIVNGESASGAGVDFGVNAELLEGWGVGLNFSWNDLKIDADVFSGGILLYEKGDRLNLSPETTMGAETDYVFAMGRSGYEGRLSASVNYTSAREMRSLVGVLPTGFVRIRSGDNMVVGRVSLSVSSPDHWSATLFVDNVGNEEGSPVTPPFSIALDQDTRIRPRTIGLQLDYRL